MIIVFIVLGFQKILEKYIEVSILVYNCSFCEMFKKLYFIFKRRPSFKNEFISFLNKI